MGPLHRRTKGFLAIGRAQTTVRPERNPLSLANLYHGMAVRMALFFGCLARFLPIIRGEVEQRTLRYLLLPPLLEHLSVAHYLKALTPVPIAEGLFALLAEPTPAWLVLAQLLAYAAVAFALAAWFFRYRELDDSGG